MQPRMPAHMGRTRARAIASPLVILLAGVGLLAATTPALAGHHEGGEAAASATADEAAPAKPEVDRLMTPHLAREKAPEKFRVKLVTTKGDVILEVTRDWAPIGADRFYNLVEIGFYDDVAFFRVIDRFMAQFGMHGAPKISRAWQRSQIRDDPVKESNVRGTLSFAKSNRPDTRTTQLFINLADNKNLDGMGFAPFARVVEGMDVVDRIYKVGEGAPRGPGPSQQRITILGNDYLREKFPKLDYIETATVLD